MKICMRIAFLGASFLFSTFPASAQNKATHNPTWWAKFQILAQNGSLPGGGPTLSSAVGANVDVSNECGPQSETFIAINPNRPKQLAAGSNEIFRLPMRGYFFGAAFNTPSHGVSINGTELAVARSTDGGKTWPQVAFFEFNGGEDHFNDKPMITADQSADSPFLDSVYIGWDAA